MTWRYRYEAKRIQSWILSSDRLKELKGGSECIEQLEKEARDLARVTGGTVHFAAAGNGELSFANESALEEFASVWPMIVAGVAPGLPLVHGWTKPGGTREELFESIGRCPPVSVDLPVPGPLTLRAGRTGRPAVVRGDDKTGLRDASTVAKLRWDRRTNLDALLPDDVELEEDSERWSGSYVAVIHADGNNVGGLFKEINEKDYARTSGLLRGATKEAARDALVAFVKWYRGQRGRIDADGMLRAPARVIVLGGDDLTVIVPAAGAMVFTRAFLEAFEQHSKSVKPGGLQAAAGVALVKSSFPFHRAYELAEELCGVAKKVEGGSRSAVAFHRVTTSQVEGYRRLRDRTLTCSDPAGARILTMGGYSLDRLAQLEELVAALKTVPAGAIREWLQLAQVEGQAADLRWRRLQEVSDLSVLDQSLIALGCQDGPWTSSSAPLGNETSCVFTPIGDALALKMAQGRGGRR